MDEPVGLQKPDRRRPEPLWHQAEMALRGLIEGGEWSAGSQLPNEDRLGEMLGIPALPCATPCATWKRPDCCGVSTAAVPSCAPRRWLPAFAA